MTEEKLKNKKISHGRIISKDKFEELSFFPESVKESIEKKAFFLLIFIPGAKQIKVNVFPVNENIKKILIRLKNFSPSTVKSISEAFKSLNLGNLIHTTGICFSDKGCYYESYVDVGKLSDEDLEKSKNTFMNIETVNEVEFIKIRTDL